MSENQPIHVREPGHNNHPGQHSFRRSIDSAVAKIGAWKKERTLAHEQGWTPDEIKVIDRFYPEGEGTEIVLFDLGEKNDRHSST